MKNCFKNNPYFIQSTHRRHETTSQVWSHIAKSGYTFNFDNARVINRDQSKGGRLLRGEWHTGCNSCNGCIQLHPAYRRYRRSNRGRPNRNQSSTRTRREERMSAEDDQTPQDHRPTTAETVGFKGETRTMANLQITMEAEPPPYRQG